MKRALLIAAGNIILAASLLIVYLGSAGHGHTDPPIRRSIDFGMLLSMSPFIITALILIIYNIHVSLKENKRTNKEGLSAQIKKEITLWRTLFGRVSRRNGSYPKRSDPDEKSQLP